MLGIIAPWSRLGCADGDSTVRPWGSGCVPAPSFDLFASSMGKCYRVVWDHSEPREGKERRASIPHSRLSKHCSALWLLVLGTFWDLSRGDKDHAQEHGSSQVGTQSTMSFNAQR